MGGIKKEDGRSCQVDELRIGCIDGLCARRQIARQLLKHSIVHLLFSR